MDPHGYLQSKALTRARLIAEVERLEQATSQTQDGWYFPCCGRWQPNRDHRCTGGMVGAR